MLHLLNTSITVLPKLLAQIGFTSPSAASSPGGLGQALGCCYVYCSLVVSDEVVEQRSGSSTPQRSCSAAGLHRARSSFDSSTAENHSLSGSLTGSLTGSTLSSASPRLGSHTMDFFEMCASLITALARWLSTPGLCLSVTPLWNHIHSLNYYLTRYYVLCNRSWCEHSQVTCSVIEITENTEIQHSVYS